MLCTGFFPARLGHCLCTANGQDSRTLRAFLEQEQAEGAEKGRKLSNLCCLCFLLFKIGMFWLRPQAALGVRLMENAQVGAP
jgi:hypothetical protein